MADNILRLRIENSEYDAKLKKAAEGIRHLAEVAHQGGGELTGLEKAELDYIRALGDMETKSRTAAGSVRELENTFKELTVVYNNLNDVEKADEGGKALAASLATLKQRAQEAKAQLDTATQSLNDNGEAGKGTSGIMEMLKDKFTVNIDAIKLFNIGLQAAEGALSIAKDAFFNNEEQLDEWGRVVESSHSLYTGFLNALNTGDISGYLSNISQIVQAAREAYDALDNLGTYNAFNQINVERTRTNMTESIADYRGGKGSKDTVKAAGEAYKKELQDRKRLENEAYLAAIKRVAAERGVSAKDLTAALSGTYGHYQDLKNVQPTGVRQTVVGSGMFARTGTETFAQTRQEKLGEVLRHLNDTELQSLQALGAQAQRTGNEIAQVDKQLTRVLNGRQTGVTGGGTTTTRTTRTAATPKTEEQQNAARISELVKQYQDLATAAKDAADAQKAGLTERMTKIQGEIKTLEARNTELKKFADEAQQIQFPVGSLPQLNEQLKTLQTEQGKALDAKQWKGYQRQIEQAQYQIDALKGKWHDGLQATIKLNMVQQGSTDINTAKPDDIAVTIKADDADVLEKLRDIEGVTIDPKTLTVTANTAEAYNQVQQLLEGVDGKTVTFAVQPKMETGTSIQNDAGMSAYIASIKQQLETADYGTSLYNGLSAQLADMNTLKNLVGESLKAGLGTAMFDVADETGRDFWTRAMEGGVENTDWQAIVDKINEKLKEKKIDAIAINFETGDMKGGKQKNDNGKEEASIVKTMSGISNGVQSIAGGMEQLGVDIPKGIRDVLNGVNGMVQILSGIMSVVTTIEVLSAIAAAKPFANGGVVRAAAGWSGVVPGNCMSGDNVPALLNSGEVVLNHAQVSAVANELQSKEGGTGSRDSFITGEQIHIVHNRYLRRVGEGELVTWKNT